ncbi:ERCC4 domain-containing protein [Pyrobaculum neutrophilum]|uniref:ERCC4 domain protein n=1 Tax=Pyrobaculum neutrophilum (strain DSM 2338 / JCM 9278 / NBRC 100436 / V24Sta) TaxID=444157 RepID=B1YD02_PYRNV|nr:ERCC4 domain protein [Pyrobaculum neutrophilum V24Sta]
MMKFELVPTVLVDSREQAEEVVRHIKEAGCAVVKTKLEVGDYVAGVFIFERKSASDFVNSIIDGRLFDQAERLKSAGLRPVIVVEGDLWEELKSRRVSPNAVLGAQLALYKMGLGLIYTEDRAQTGALLCLAAKKEGGGKVKAPAAKKGSDVRALQIALLASLPGIGPKRAEELLKRFGTPLNALLNYRSWNIDERRHAAIKRILETPYSSGSQLDDFL